jgi:hypothetical protein
MRTSAALVLLFLGGCSDRATPNDDGGVTPARDLARRSDAILSCDAIANEYDVQLELVRICNPLINALQCTKLHYRALRCPGCGSYVNPANAAALARLAELEQAWKVQRCGEGIMCPAIDCMDPRSGSCEATPPGSKVPGLCKNEY